MTRTEYKAEIGTSYKIVTSVMFIIGLSFVIYPVITEHRMIWLFVLIGAMFIFIGAFLILISKTWYTFSDEGLKIEGYGKYAMMNEEYLENAVPYSSITGFYEARDVSYSLALTVNALRVEYRKMNGRKDSFAISPVDKEEFIAELEKRTGLRMKS